MKPNPPLLLKKSWIRITITVLVVAIAMTLLVVFTKSVFGFILGYYFAQMIIRFLKFIGAINETPMNIFKLPNSVISSCLFIMQTKEYKEWANKQLRSAKKESK